ncbi:hypothetical protein BH10ACI3_BH10ACI3_16860 [soil metagenome]
MKRCPECRRDYYDDTLLYCLDDGNALLDGPASVDEPKTQIMSHERASGEGETQLLDRNSAVWPAVSQNRRMRYVVVALVVIAAAGGAFEFYKYYSGDVRQPAIRSIAVLPLENLSADPAQEYFADGMTETLIGNLSQIKSLTVTSRRSVMRFKGSKDSVSEIAATLGVNAVIEGTVQRADGRIKITTQLILASNNAPIWSRNYESDLKDVLKLQSDVAQAIASEVNAKLTLGELNRLDSVKTIDPQAHEAYLLGTYHLQRLNEKDLALAVSYFEQAAKIAPDFAEAYAGLSRAWSESGIWGGMTPSQTEPMARAAAEKALELDPGNSAAHAALAAILMNRDYDWGRAEAEAKRAIELDPGYADGYVTYAWVLQCLGRHDEVTPKMEMAKRLDPVSTQIESDYGRMLYRARKYAEAETHLKRSIELDSNNSSAYGRLVDVYVEQGRYDEAIAMNRKADELRPKGPYNLRLATIYARMGKAKEALEILNQSKQTGSLERVRSYSALGDLDNAFKILNDAFENKDSLLSNIKEEPGLEGLHGGPRWKEFLRRMNFPD